MAGRTTKRNKRTSRRRIGRKTRSLSQRGGYKYKATKSQKKMSSKRN